MGFFGTEILPGLAVLVLALTQASVRADEMYGEIMAALVVVVAALGLPRLSVVIWRATLNVLEERFDKRYETQEAFVAMQAALIRETTEVRTSHQTLMDRLDAVGRQVGAIQAETSAALHKLEIDQLNGFAVVKDEIRTHLDGSIVSMLERVEEIIHRKL